MKPTWRDIFQFCSLQMSGALPPAKSEWLEGARKHRYVFDLMDAIGHVEKPHEEEISWAIAEWKRSGDWPPISENTRFLLRLRFGAAASFAHLHGHPKTGETIFEVPDLEIREICAWLISEWWELHGRKECAIEWTCEFEPREEPTEDDYEE